MKHKTKWNLTSLINLMFGLTIVWTVGTSNIGVFKTLIIALATIGISLGQLVFIKLCGDWEK